MTYSQNDVLRIAKRVNNTKRSYLLVNRLQAKHIPVSPGRALEMMEQLGDLLAQKYPDTRLVIGFAETATAIGAAVASRFGDDCIYLHTTREALPEVEQWVLFWFLVLVFRAIIPLRTVLNVLPRICCATSIKFQGIFKFIPLLFFNSIYHLIMCFFNFYEFV